jgi:hypothetical protein
MIVDLLRRLLRRPRPDPDAEYGQMVDRLQVERSREHQRAIRTNRRLHAGLESLRAESGLYEHGIGD